MNPSDVRMIFHVSTRDGSTFRELANCYTVATIVDFDYRYIDSSDTSSGVETTTFETVCNMYAIEQIDVLYIDVDRYDVDILKDAGHILGKIRRILIKEPTHPHSIDALLKRHHFTKVEPARSNCLEYFSVRIQYAA